jgi:6-phosphofructo-2-kinase/fructose-2,6-biphosphatase
MYNQRGLIGGDSPLSPAGEAYARALPAVLASRVPPAEAAAAAAAAALDSAGNSSLPPAPVCVWTSTLRRTIQTAAHLPYAKLRWKALDEIDAGVCDGLTYEEIARRFPQEAAARARDKLRYRYPRGESYLDLVQRMEPVIAELERDGGRSVCIVAHQAVLRVLVGYLLACPQDSVPGISIPLHTLIELTPRPDGTMSVAYIPVATGGAAAAAGHQQQHKGPTVAAAAGAGVAAVDALAQRARDAGVGAALPAATAKRDIPQQQQHQPVPGGDPLSPFMAAAAASGTARATGGLTAHASSSKSSPALAGLGSGQRGVLEGAAEEPEEEEDDDEAAGRRCRGGRRPIAEDGEEEEEEDEELTLVSRHASCSSAATLAFYGKGDAAGGDGSPVLLPATQRSLPLPPAREGDDE